MRLLVDISRVFLVGMLLTITAFAAGHQSADGKGPGKADQSAEARQQAAKQGSINLESARQRWERLTPEEQDRMRERYEKLRAMGEAERRDLERRRRHLERVESQLVERLNDRDRARLAALSQDERDRILREMVEDELHVEARRLEEKLPTDWRVRLRNASPEDRARFFQDFKRQVNSEWSPRALEKLGVEFGVPPHEVEAWKRLPIDQQKQKLLELGKRHRREAVREHGLPEGVAPEEWQRLDSLPPDRFFEEAMRMREAQGWEPGRPFLGGPPEGADEAWRSEARKFRSASRTRPEDRLEFSHLPPDERREQVDRQRRERLLSALRDSGLVEPNELQSMRSMTNGEFWRRARQLNQELSLGFGDPRGDRRGDPRQPRGDGDGPPRRGNDFGGPPPYPPGRGGDAGGPPPPRRGEGEDRRRNQRDNADVPPPPRADPPPPPEKREGRERPRRSQSKSIVADPSVSGSRRVQLKEDFGSKARASRP